jgi:tetratricopeptide (TPR) repeat protein
VSALINERFNRAVGFHRNGDLLRAEKIYREVLAEVAGHFDALHSLGVLLIQTGRLEGGVELIDTALAIRPDCVEALSNRGYALKALKRLDAALASCDRALAIKPDYAGALNNRGLVLIELKRFDEALASFDRALAITPDQAVILNDRGVVLAKLKRFEEALAATTGRSQSGRTMSRRSAIAASC